MAVIPKSYLYKVYRSGVYLGNLPYVTSEFGFAQDINTAGSQVTAICAISPDVASLPNSTIDDESGNPIQTEAGLNLQTERAEDVVGNSADDILIRNGNVVKIWEFSDTYPNGKIRFMGAINRWEADFGGDGGDDQITMLIYSDGQDTEDYVIAPSDTKSVTQESDDGTNYDFSAGGRSLAGVAQTFTVPSNISISAVSFEASSVAGLDVYVELRLQASPTGPNISNYGSDELLGVTSIHIPATGGVKQVFKASFIDALSVTTGNTYYFFVWGINSNDCKVYMKAGNPYANGQVWTAIQGATYWGFTSVSGSDLYFDIWQQSSISTSPSFTTQDPSSILKAVIDDYSSKGGMINYTSSSVDSTGLSLPYAFNTNTTLEGIKAMLSIAPDGFYWYVDCGSDILYFKNSSLTADLTIIKGIHINALRIIATIENIKNKLFFSGGDTGGGVNLYSTYEDTTSIKSFGQKLDRQSDNRVTVQATANAIGTSFISENADEQYQTTVTLIDGTIDTTTIHVGQVLGFRGFGSFADNLLAQIVRAEYAPDSVKLTLGILPKRMMPDFEKVRKGLVALQTIDNPATPS